VPRRGGWRAWGPVRVGFERALADPPDSAIAAAEIASEPRRGADYVRVTVAMAAGGRDVADALAIAWDAFAGAQQTTSIAGTSLPPRPRSGPGRLSVRVRAIRSAKAPYRRL
jgi:hypothetical protein